MATSTSTSPSSGVARDARRRRASSPPTTTLAAPGHRRRHAPVRSCAVALTSPRVPLGATRHRRQAPPAGLVPRPVRLAARCATSTGACGPHHTTPVAAPPTSPGAARVAADRGSPSAPSSCWSVSLIASRVLLDAARRASTGRSSSTPRSPCVVGYGPSVWWCLYASRPLGERRPPDGPRPALPLVRPRVGSARVADAAFGASSSWRSSSRVLDIPFIEQHRGHRRPRPRPHVRHHAAGHGRRRRADRRGDGLPRPDAARAAEPDERRGSPSACRALLFGAAHVDPVRGMRQHRPRPRARRRRRRVRRRRLPAAPHRPDDPRPRHLQRRRDGRSSSRSTSTDAVPRPHDDGGRGRRRRRRRARRRRGGGRRRASAVARQRQRRRPHGPTDATATRWRCPDATTRTSAPAIAGVEGVDGAAAASPSRRVRVAAAAGGRRRAPGRSVATASREPRRRARRVPSRYASAPTSRHPARSRRSGRRPTSSRNVAEPARAVGVLAVEPDVVVARDARRAAPGRSSSRRRAKARSASSSGSS